MHKAPAGTVLAFDFGEARIGVAQGDAELGLSHPLATVTGNSNDEKFNAIAKLIREWQPKHLVVGLPTHADGTEHELTRLSRKFGRRLHGRFNLPIYIGWMNACLRYMRKACLPKRRCSGANRRRYSTKWRLRRFCRAFSMAEPWSISTAGKKVRKNHPIERV